MEKSRILRSLEKSKLGLNGSLACVATVYSFGSLYAFKQMYEEIQKKKNDLNKNISTN